MRRYRTAFTLVELLVVVSIIGLLLGMVLPSVGRARQIAARAVCATNLHGLAPALRMYLNENNDVMPVAAQMPSLRLNDEPRIVDVLTEFVDDPDVYKCPGDTEVTYFEREGSSYEYHSMLGGRRVSESFLSKRFGEAKTPVMNDYEPFHGRPGEPRAMNYLFADCHVGDLK